MKLIVGLGNPGEQYTHTKHNLGFTVVEKLLKDYSGVKQEEWSNNEKLKSEITIVEWQPKVGKLEKVILAKPKTYMNNSGLAVQLIASYYKIPAEDVWVVYDELDLPIGAMKIRFGGAAAGHHGVESIMAALSTDKFWRFRLGIGSSQHHAGRQMREDGHEHEISKRNVHNARDYVLSPFTGSEKGKVRELIKNGVEALETALEKGLDCAMNRFNTK